MNHLKCLVINAPFECDLSNIIQIARAEGMKLYRNPQKIKVLDVINRSYGWLVVVQNGDGCISEEKKLECKK